MHSPRPILKRSAAHGAPNSSSSKSAVHFPPSSSLTTHTFTAYSSSAYDRSPIEVSPNSCALPERGCPGRTYTLDETRDTDRDRYYNSRRRHDSSMPPLIPDLSSESDESDGFSSPPLDSYSPSKHVLGLAIPRDLGASYSQYNDPYAYPISPSALAFLPHPPSPPSSRTTYDDDDTQPSPKQRRPRRERRHDPSRSPDRIPDAPSPTITIRTPTKKRGPLKSLSQRHSVPSSFCVEDDGCLGGF